MNRAKADQVVAGLAADQWGLVTVSQAENVGVSRLTLTRMASEGSLVRLSQGVYALRGATGALHLELRAAWLALEPHRTASERFRDAAPAAVVSHASAASLYGYGDLTADQHEFTVPARRQSRRPDVRFHRRTLVDDAITVIDGLPVTTPEQLIVDLLQDHHDGGHVADVLAGAVRADTVDVAQLAPRLAPLAARRGFPRLDGDGLLWHLLDMGGVADDVQARNMVATGRATLTAAAALGSSDFAAHIAQLARTPAFAKLLEAQHAALNAQLATVLTSAHFAPVTSQLRDAVNAYMRQGTPHALGSAAMGPAATKLTDALNARWREQMAAVLSSGNFPPTTARVTDALNGQRREQVAARFDHDNLLRATRAVVPTEPEDSP